MEKYKQCTKEDIKNLRDNSLQEWVNYIKSKNTIDPIQIFYYFIYIICFIVFLTLLILIAIKKGTTNNWYFFLISFILFTSTIWLCFCIYELISKTIISKKLHWYYDDHISFFNDWNKCRLFKLYPSVYILKFNSFKKQQIKEKEKEKIENENENT